MTDRPIVAATDLSARSDRAVDRAIMLAGDLGVRAQIVHAYAPGRHAPDEAVLREAVRDVLPDPQADVDIILACGSPPTMIADAGKDAALIVTGVARHNQFSDYFLGTAVDYIIRHANVPILVIKKRPRHAYTQLLVATDFSDCSRTALLAAATLFPKARLRLVHAYHMPYETHFTSSSSHDQLKAEVEADMAAFMASPAISDALRSKIEIDLRYGSTAAAIAASIEDYQPDLFVLGTHGKSALAHAVFGRSAESLLCWVPVDTLVVRPE